MAAPAPTTRGTPVGIHLDDGFSTKITFARFPTVSFWEKTVKPMGMDGGDKIDTSTMHNIDFRTYAPRALITMTDGSATVAYDPNVLNQIKQMINVRDTVTFTFPDGSTDAAFAFLKSFERNDNKEGEQPEATIMICPTNTDSTGAEQGPVTTSVSGT